MKQPPTAWRRLGRGLAAIAGLALAALLAAVLHVRIRGLPGWAVTRLADRLSTREYAFEAAAVRFRSAALIEVRGVKVFRKRQIGPPLAEAADVLVGWSPLAALRGANALSSVTIRGGRLPAEALRPSAGVSAAQPLPRAGAVQVRLRQCDVAGVTVEDLAGRAVAADDELRLSGVRGTVRNGDLRGAVEGSVVYRPGRAELIVETGLRLDPHLLVPLLAAMGSRTTVQLIRRFEFPPGAAPECDLRLSHVFGRERNLHAEARIRLAECRYRGVDVSRAWGTVHVDETGDGETVRIDPLCVERPEGMARGGIAVDSRADTVTFDGVSDLALPALSRIVGILTNGVLDGFDFAGGVNLNGRGRVGCSDLDKCDFRLDAAGGETRAYGLRMDSFRASLRMLGATNTVESFAAALYGGTVKGSSTLTYDATSMTNTGYRVSLKASDIPVETLAAALLGGGSSGATGRLSGEVDLSGSGGADPKMSARGRGAVRIDDGRVFSLPLFGGLSDFMKRVVPGLDFVLTQSSAKAEFTVYEGRVHSDEIRVRGDVLSLTGHGDYRLGRDLDLYAQVTLMKDHTLVAKVLRVLTYPISKLLEFRVRGPVSEPQWYPINFSRDVLRLVGAEPGK